MTAPKIVRIDPDGSVRDIEGGDLLGVARAAFGMVDVVTCRAPFYEGRLIGAVDDWGRVKGLAVNWKAWAVYGRSPIFGPMFVACDQDEAGHRDPLPALLVTLLRSEVTDLVDTETLAVMKKILTSEGLR